MMTVQQTAPFSGSLLFAVSRYSFPAIAKSAAGRRNPSYLLATPDTPCVFFYVVAQAHPFFGLWCLHLSPCQIMVVRAGQPSGWPVSNKAGIPTPDLFLPMSVGTLVVAITATYWRLLLWLRPSPRHTRSLSLCLPPFVAQTVNPVFVCFAPLPVMSTSFPRSRLRPLVYWPSAGCGGARMRHTTITARDLKCLEHMRNVGQLVNELMQVQDCATVRRAPAQQLQLTSVIYLMTVQLDGVVERCNQYWLTGEGYV